VFDSGATVSSDGRHIAFRRSDARAGAKSGTAVLYVLHAGDTRASPVYRHRLGPIGCGVGASMRWNGRHLLYTTSDGQVAIIDAAGRARNLATLLEAIPQRAGEQPTAGWLDDYPAPRASAR
jgi:hypothetical protein